MTDRPVHFAVGGFVQAGPAPVIMTNEYIVPKDHPLFATHVDQNGRWSQPPYPPHTRVYADFTGLAQSMEQERKTYSVTEMARMRAEAEEAGEQPPFQHTVDIGRYQELTPKGGEVHMVFTPANDGGEPLTFVSRNRQLIRDLLLGEFDPPKPAANDDTPPAVGLSGFAQTGKTAVANYIESKYGYRRQHIAEPLRDMLRTLLRRFSLSDELIDEFLTGSLKEELIPELGVTSRSAQISIGTEWGRELVHPDLWANLWAHEAEQIGGKAMNDSVRFANEERAIREDLGGFTIMIVRPGTGPVAFRWKRLGPILLKWFGSMRGVHPSERVDLLNPDYVIKNDGTLEELYEKVDEVFALEGAYRRLQCAS